MEQLERIFFKEFTLDLEETIKSGKAAELNFETVRKLIDELRKKGYFCIVLPGGDKALRKVLIGGTNEAKGEQDFYKIAEGFGLKYKATQPSPL